MKIIKVEFKAESDQDIFCEVKYIEKFGFWKNKSRTVIRSCHMRKYTSGYCNLPKWCDDGLNVHYMMRETIAAQMGLAHQQWKSKRADGVYSRYPLFDHMSKEHDLTLQDYQLDKIISIVNQMQSATL